MKLKNIMKDVRQLRAAGQIIYVKPGETIEVEKPIYDDRVFEVVHVKSKEKQEQNIAEKEVSK